MTKLEREQGAKIHRLYCGIYNQDILVVWDINDYIKMRNHLKKCFKGIKKMLPKKQDSAYATVYQDKKTKGILAVFNKNITIPVIAHEAFHITEFVFEKSGIQHSDTSSEAWAYYIESVTRSLIRLLYPKIYKDFC